MCILPAGALQAEQLISILNPEQVANELAKKAKQQKKEKSRTRRRARHRADPEAAARAAALEAAAQNEKRLVLEADIHKFAQAAHELLRKIMLRQSQQPANAPWTKAKSSSNKARAAKKAQAKAAAAAKAEAAATMIAAVWRSHKAKVHYHILWERCDRQRRKRRTRREQARAYRAAVRAAKAAALQRAAAVASVNKAQRYVKAERCLQAHTRSALATEVAHHAVEMACAQQTTILAQWNEMLTVERSWRCYFKRAAQWRKNVRAAERRLENVRAAERRLARAIHGMSTNLVRMMRRKGSIGLPSSMNGQRCGDKVRIGPRWRRGHRRFWWHRRLQRDVRKRPVGSTGW